MSTPTTAEPDSVLDAPAVAARAMPTRPLYWSIRRELWENRSVYLAPLAMAALVLFATSIGMFGLPRRLAAAVDAAQQHLVVMRPFRMAPAPIMLVSFVVGMFYALDALYGDRRDRSILFWKSLPVSDVTTVLSKACIPLAVLPLIAFALSLATIVLLLLPSTVVLLAKGLGPGRLWSEVVLRQPLVMIYGLAVHALWLAPIYAWLLMISAWARRTPFLWAVLPPLALGIAERLAFQTAHFGSFVKYRLTGAMARAFVLAPGNKGNVTRLTELDPLGFLGTPGLWSGLLAAALFLAVAVRLRRRGEPI